MKMMVQAFTGGVNAPAHYDVSAGRLMAVCDKCGADAVIIGWSDRTRYDDIVRRLHERDIMVYLWLPVFAEYGDDMVAARDFMGNVHAKAVSDAHDDFEFACPVNPHNIERAVRYYDQYFVECGFDGVFLDKIRFSSFGNGFPAGMGCFCEQCRDVYGREGIDMGVFDQLMAAGDKRFLMPAARSGMRYTFGEPLIDNLYRARSTLITASVQKAAAMFRQRGLTVGLDVFAPPLAYWVGQDIEALARCADFMKPMTYRVTHAPAGIPYECRHMKTELAQNGCAIGDTLEKLWGTADLASDQCFAAQLRLLEASPCDIYAGVEVNNVRVCATSRAYVEKSLDAIKQSGVAGCVLSWNVLEDTVFP